MNAIPAFLAVSEVADIFKVSDMTVYRLINAGDLTAIRVGRRYRVTVESVTRYVEDNEVRIGSLTNWVAVPSQIRAVS